MQIRRAVLVAVAMCSCGQALANDGERIPPEETRYDAVCAVGLRAYLRGESGPQHDHHNYGTGTLITDRLVLTARHVFPDESATLVTGPAPMDGGEWKYTVRFRRQPDGSVGDKCNGGVESYHQVDVVYWYALQSHACSSGAVDMVVLELEEPVTHIEPIEVWSGVYPDEVVDSWSVGWGVSNTDVPDPCDGRTRGVPRLWQGDAQLNWCRPRYDAITVPGASPFNWADSGSPVFIETPCGTLGIAGGVSVATLLYELWLENPDPPPGHTHGPGFDPSATLPGIAGRPFDLTDSSDPLAARYGLTDGHINLDDLMYMLVQTAQGNTKVDLSGSGDPTNPAYGVPDGVANDHDVAYWVAEVVDPSSCVAPSLYSPLPLRPGYLDVNGDGRFNPADVSALDAQITSGAATHDFDGSGGVDFYDLLLLSNADAIAGHGALSDLDVDNDTDCDDLAGLQSLIAASDPFTDIPSYDPGYMLALDADLDGDTDELDRSIIGRVLQFSDIYTSSATARPATIVAEPDLVVDESDVRGFLWSAHVGGHPRPADVSGPSAEPDGVTDIYDLVAFFDGLREACSPLAGNYVRAGWDTSGEAGVPDGRFNWEDYQWFVDYDAPPAPGDEIWDMNGDGVIDRSDGAHITGVLLGAGTVPVATYDHGYLGDLDGDAAQSCHDGVQVGNMVFLPPDVCSAGDRTMDCDDLALIRTTLASDNLFDGRSITDVTCPAGTPGCYLYVLDADMDGDNDVDDWAAIAAHMQPADIAPPYGVVDPDDHAQYDAWFNAGDPRADWTVPFGTLDIYDYLAYVDDYDNHPCPNP